MSEKDEEYVVPAVRRAIQILETIDELADPPSMTEIANELSLPKSSVFLLLKTLEKHEMIYKTDQDAYQLGIGLYRLGMSSMHNLSVRSEALPYMEQLAEDTGLAVHLATSSKRGAVYIEKVESPGFVKFDTHVGQRQYYHASGVGKVLAAHMEEEQLDALIDELGLPRQTTNTITSRSTFKDHLRTIRDQGYALEVEEGQLDVGCLAAPVTNETGRVVASISLTCLKSNLRSDRLPELVDAIKQTAENISRELGSGASREEEIESAV